LYGKRNTNAHITQIQTAEHWPLRNWKNEISNLVIFSIAKSYKKNGGKLIALTKYRRRSMGYRFGFLQLEFTGWRIYWRRQSLYHSLRFRWYMNLIEGKAAKSLTKYLLAEILKVHPQFMTIWL